jgi:hypothetical protein
VHPGRTQALGLGLRRLFRARTRRTTLRCARPLGPLRAFAPLRALPALAVARLPVGSVTVSLLTAARPTVAGAPFPPIRPFAAPTLDE